MRAFHVAAAAAVSVSVLPDWLWRRTTAGHRCRKNRAFWRCCRRDFTCATPNRDSRLEPPPGTETLINLVIDALCKTSLTTMPVGDRVRETPTLNCKDGDFRGTYIREQDHYVRSVCQDLARRDVQRRRDGKSIAGRWLDGTKGPKGSVAYRRQRVRSHRLYGHPAGRPRLLGRRRHESGAARSYSRQDRRCFDRCAVWSKLRRRGCPSNPASVAGSVTAWAGWVVGRAAADRRRRLAPAWLLGTDGRAASVPSARCFGVVPIDTVSDGSPVGDDSIWKPNQPLGGVPIGNAGWLAAG